MPSHNDIKWWIDHAGGFHTCDATESEAKEIYARGSVDPEAHMGVIIRFRGRDAVIGTIPHELIDLLESRFPGTRWSIQDPAPNQTRAHADSA